MRGILLTAIVGLLLLTVFKHPVMGAYLWAWLSLMAPHKLTYGFAFTLPFAQVTAIVLLIALAFTRKRQPLPINGITLVLFAMLVWMSVTSLVAITPQDRVIERWIFVMKIQLMLLVTWMLVIDARQLRVLVWVVTLSVAFFGIKGGIWTVFTGGGGRVWGPPGGLLQGNNELAVGLVMLVPMMYFLYQTEPRRWLRYALLGSMVAMLFAILGSQSRGALVALLAMAFFLGIKGKHPVGTSLGLLLLVGLVIGFMPDTWTTRMRTINQYELDTSALSRLWTWQTLWNVAVDRPLFGAGFRADDAYIFARYAPLHGDYAIFEGSVWVAHSIYFQMLGEHGFVGLGLFLLLGLVAWWTAGRLARESRDDPEYGSWMPMLMRMVQVSMIGYAAGGAFLSLAYLDLPYYIMGFIVTCHALMQRRRKEAAVAARTPGTTTANPALASQRTALK